MANKMLFGYNFGKLSIAVIPFGQDKAEKGDWQDVDVSELHEELQEAYDLYKTAYKEAKALREDFEAKMREMAGITKAKPAVTTKPRQSLADYLASRR